MRFKYCTNYMSIINALKKYTASNKLRQSNQNPHLALFAQDHYCLWTSSNT